ncbi:anti-sigma factor [Microbacterium invictum]|uniref:Anti-sigma factor n=1 Tax=Microbacterium invictum TaxID=515415 RepID=A0ABZ0VH92_9MICO|nr:anti-sigma factor [Microbacterium invictum]WQB71870.1 anti-sigma factor [Microbacterium invictum]
MPHLESHLDPEVLTLLAIGEPVATPAEQDHLSTCPRCGGELSALSRTVVAGRSTVLLEDLESPPERVWSRISEELGFSGSTAISDAAAASEIDPAAETVRLEPADAGERAAAESGGAPAPARRRTGLLRGLFVLAASVAILGVAVGGWALTRQATVVELASAELAAFPDHPGAEGSAVVVERGDERVIEVTLDADVDPGSNREVWLITEDATSIVSLGMLEGQTGEFVVPADIDLREYVLVDVSDEPVDGDPAHSGDSIVRGALDFA